MKLSKVGNFGGIGQLLGSGKTDHPLADARELKRAVAELPRDNAFRALDEVVGWLESLYAAEGFPADKLFEAVRQLDEAAQIHVRRLTKDYLHTLRPSQAEENRLWNIVHGYWLVLGKNYEKCLELDGLKNRRAEISKAQRPLLLCRAIAALGCQRKWDQFRYGPPEETLWERLGRLFLAAEEMGDATRPAQLYPATPGMTTPTLEYLKILVLQASSMDSLLPHEVELADRLVTHFLPGFVFGPQDRPDSVYWIDLAKSGPPQRLARMPEEASPTLRFFQPGGAHANMEKLKESLQRGEGVPPDLNLGAQYQAKALLAVIRHLAGYWSPIPPQRKHDRHYVKHRMTVLGGLVHSLAAFSGAEGLKLVELPMESWIAHNVSRGGFGAQVSNIRGDWLRIGVLVALQPEGGSNWLLGVVRRYCRDTASTAQVGVESLAHEVLAVELRPRTVSTYASGNKIPALWLQDGNAPGEARMVFPTGSFDLRESMELFHEGRPLLFSPVALVEQTPEHEIGRYRIREESR